MTRTLLALFVVLVSLATTGPAFAGPKKADSAAGCDAACKHRKACAVPGADDVAGCVQSCKAITPLLGPNDLTDYAKAECPRALAMESGFRAAAGTARVCAHRAGCMAGADAKAGLATNVAIAQSLPPEALQKVVGDYLAWSCEQVKADEPNYQGAQSCVRACTRAVGCLKRGDVGGCALQCAAGLQQGKWKAGEVAAFEKADCAAIARAFPPPPPPRPTMDATRKGDGCRQNGTKDCPLFSVCCSYKGGEMADPGESGTCISPAICMMPRR